METSSLAAVLLYGSAALAAPVASPPRAHERDYEEKWEDYKAAARKDLASLEAKIAALEVRTRELTGDARMAAEQKLGDLRGHKIAADRFFADLQKSAGKARRQLKKDFDLALRDFKSAYREAASP